MLETDQMVKTGDAACCALGWLCPHYAPWDQELATATGDPDDHHPACRQALDKGHHHSHFVDPRWLALQEIGDLLVGAFDPALDRQDGRWSLGFFHARLFPSWRSG